eukprot:901021-Prymnesium_polylepis.1
MVGTRFWPYLTSICVSEAEAFTYEGRGSSAPFPLVFRARMRRISIARCSFRSSGVQPGAVRGDVLGVLALLDMHMCMHMYMCREPEPFETFEDPVGWEPSNRAAARFETFEDSGRQEGCFGPR